MDQFGTRFIHFRTSNIIRTFESSERNYQNAQKLLEEKREQFQRACERNISDRSNDSTLIGLKEFPLPWTWICLTKKVNEELLCDKSCYNSTLGLAEEISNLELVVNNLQSEYESVSYERRINEYSRTIHGKLFKSSIIFHILLHLSDILGNDKYPI